MMGDGFQPLSQPDFNDRLTGNANPTDISGLWL